MNDDATFQFGSNAKVIADSVSPAGDRVTTIEATMHRFVLAEFNTHRVFSRNSASSRAIPFPKQVERVVAKPAVPVSFPSEQRGMQGGEELGQIEREAANREWLKARNSAVNHAKQLAAYGVHKSVVNRILEPFMWHTVIVTATDWDGFWDQRCSPLAQPEIRGVAEQMRAVYNASTPHLLAAGEWHLPYITEDDWESAYYIIDAVPYSWNDEEFNEAVVDIVKRVSTARSARVSYLNHDGTRDIEKDLGLYDKLVSARPLHASPLEHVCRPLEYLERPLGNLRNWRQFRHEVELYG